MKQISKRIYSNIDRPHLLSTESSRVRWHVGEREIHLLVSWGKKYLNVLCLVKILKVNKINLIKEISTATFGENLKTERIEKHGRWKVGIVWNWRDEDRIHGEMQYLEGGWAYTGFCCAVHPAGVSLQFIKSSDIKVWKWWWRGLSHTSRHGWDNGHSRNDKRGVAVLERANHSWLVKEEDWQSSVSCIYVCVCVVSGIVSACRGGKRTSGRELASQQWQSNPRGRWRVRSHTRAGMACH